MLDQAKYLINPDSAIANPSNARGALTRAQWQMFYDRYRPLEQNVADMLLRDIEPQVHRSGDQVRRAFDNAESIQDRMRQRYGLRRTAYDDRVTKLNKTLGIAAAENSARREWENQRLQGLGQMLSIGKGISGSSGSALSDAASLQNQRIAAGRQAEAQAKAQQTQLLGTAAGLALAFLL